MYLTSALQRVLIIGGIALIAVIALVAITHNPSTPRPVAVNAEPVAANPEPVAAPAGNMPAVPTVYAASPFGPSATPLPVPPAPAMASASEPAEAPMMESAVRTQPVVARRYVRPRRYRSRRRVVVRRRPWG